MEAVKDRFAGLRRHAGTFVVDADADFVADMRRGNFDQPFGRGEAYGIVDDRVDGAGETVRLAHHDRGVLARPSEGDSRIALLAAGFPGGDDLLDQGAEIDSLEGRAVKLGIATGGFAD